MHELSITFTRQGGQVVQVAVALQSFAETKDIKVRACMPERRPFTTLFFNPKDTWHTDT